jgi:hypothetical protein
MKPMTNADMNYWGQLLFVKYGIVWPIDLPEDNDEETWA